MCILFIFRIFLALNTQIRCGAPGQVQIRQLIDDVGTLRAISILVLLFLIAILQMITATLLVEDVLLDLVLVLRIILLNEVVLRRIQHRDVIVHVAIEAAVLEDVRI